MTSDAAVLTRDAGAVLVITINRPQARNAVNLAVAEGIAAALDELDARDDLAAGILTGAGTSFCAGMDLKAFLAGERPTIPGRGFAGIVERGPEKPLVAAVEGYALAGGCEVALACDLIVAAEGAQFGLPEVKRGLVAAGGGLLRLPQRVPYHVAMELCLTGDPVGAGRAAAIGLVNRVVADGDALDAALELAGRIAGNAPLALRATKRVIAESRDWAAGEAFELQAAITEPIRTTEDAREGATAFAEKRPPAWRGR